MSQTNAILTGSRAYGTPRADSDIDVVVFMDSTTAAQLIASCETWDENYDGLSKRGAALRFGNLNLLIETSAERFEGWRKATEELVARAPVTRDEAKAVIKFYCKED